MGMVAVIPYQTLFSSENASSHLSLVKRMALLPMLTESNSYIRVNESGRCFLRPKTPYYSIG